MSPDGHANRTPVQVDFRRHFVTRLPIRTRNPLGTPGATDFQASAPWFPDYGMARKALRPTRASFYFFFLCFVCLFFSECLLFRVLSCVGAGRTAAAPDSVRTETRQPRRLGFDLSSCWTLPAVSTTDAQGFLEADGPFDILDLAAPRERRFWMSCATWTRSGPQAPSRVYGRIDLTPLRLESR